LYNWAMFVKPEEVVKNLNLDEGMKVADIGAGSGHYTIALARMLKGGRVYAIDIQKDVLGRLQNEAHRMRLSNVSTILCDLDKPNATGLNDSILDAVILSNVLFQLDNRENIIKECLRILKSKGKALVVDWTDTVAGIGPDSNRLLDKKSAIKMFEERGFELIKDVSAGDHHFGVIFRKNE